MDPLEILTDFTELSDDQLSEYVASLFAAFGELRDADTITADELDRAEAYAAAIEAAQGEEAARAQAVAELTARHAALQTRFQREDAEPDEVEATDDNGDDNGDDLDAEVVEAEVVDEPPIAARSTVAVLAKRTSRPTKPAASRAPITITAAADVPQFSTGSDLGNDFEKVGQALVNRMKGFGTPTGDGSIENLQHYGVAMFKLDFPNELTIDRHSDDMEVLYHAMDEARLPGGSLVASGGWCAPSETIYDLCSGETAEGLLSVPEVNVARGGIKYTSGPDFASIYSNVGFCQTEAQAIAGTAKTCYEVPCPAFTEVRLDACGLCIKAPILTNAAYPELVQRYLSGGMIAHQHKMNAKVIAAMATAAGTAKTVTAYGSTVADMVDSLALIADGIRSKYRLSPTASMEVVLPWWVKGAMQNDLDNRNGCGGQSVESLFASRNLNVQYVYDWQDTPFPAGTAPAIGYPATVQALIYPAGTFIKGTADVINLNAVYDAASLVQNLYTALFFEQGILVAKMCYEAQLVTIPVCNAGRTGSANLTCA